MEDFVFGWVLASFLIAVIKSFKRFWYLWLAGYIAFLFYRHLVLGAN